MQTLHLADWLGPLGGALVFVAILSLVNEPLRHKLNALAVVGAAATYVGGALGPWELVYVVVGFAVGYRALGSYRWIAVGWWMHAGWDLVHHYLGSPIWPWMPTSSFGCTLFDSAIAVWFVAGAPSIWRRRATVPA
jgi:hypothetical protein